jgi:hypothetical protein
MALLTNTLTFTGTEAREYLLKPLYEDPLLNMLFDIRENVVADEQIAFLGSFGKMFKADSGCTTPTPSAGAPRTQKKWTPKLGEFFKSYCAADESFAQLEVYAKATGADIHNLLADRDQSFLNMLLEQLGKDIVRDTFRASFLNDTTITSGDVSPGVDETFYNWSDGAWKRIFQDVAANNLTRVTITENTTTQTLVEDYAARQNFSAYKYLKAVHDQSKNELKQVAPSDKHFIVTGSFWDNWIAWKESGSTEQAYIKDEQGIAVGQFRGSDIIAVRSVDSWISSDFATGSPASLDLPHRIIYKKKDAIVLGMDAVNAPGDYQIWYENKDKKNYMRGNYKFDCQVLFPELVTVAY